MPNWCNNKLEIEDCSPELAAYLQENGLSFEKIKPTPPEKLTDEKGSWYQWRVDNWGTKWDLDEESVFHEYDKNKYSFLFNTAWSPPCAAIITLSKKFPDDEFVLRYLEFGCCFGGTAYISDGSCRRDDNIEGCSELNRFAVEFFGYDPEDFADEEGDDQ